MESFLRYFIFNFGAPRVVLASLLELWEWFGFVFERFGYTFRSLFDQLGLFRSGLGPGRAKVMFPPTNVGRFWIDFELFNRFAQTARLC